MASTNVRTLLLTGTGAWGGGTKGLGSWLPATGPTNLKSSANMDLARGERLHTRNTHWNMTLKVHWTVPVNVHWENDSPLGSQHFPSTRA